MELNPKAIEEKEMQEALAVFAKYGVPVSKAANSRTSSIILGLPKENKRKQKEQEKEGSVASSKSKIRSVKK